MWTQLGPRKRKTSDVTMPTGVNLGTNTIRGSAEVKLSRDVLGGRIWGSPRPTCTPPPCTMTRRTCCSSCILRKAARSCTGRACRQNLSRLSEPTSKFVQVLLGMPLEESGFRKPPDGDGAPNRSNSALFYRHPSSVRTWRTWTRAPARKSVMSSLKREATPGTGCTPCHM